MLNGQFRILYTDYTHTNAILGPSVVAALVRVHALPLPSIELHMYVCIYAQPTYIHTYVHFVCSVDNEQLLK